MANPLRLGSPEIGDNMFTIILLNPAGMRTLFQLKNRTHEKIAPKWRLP